ncbi:4437_t:CDS:2, partial [Cetraspora pellucida]
MVKKQKYNKKHTTSKPPLRNIERNNLFEDESQVTNVEITENKRKRISSRTNVKKKNENEEPSLTDSDNDMTRSVGDSRSRSRISKNIQPQSEQASNASSNESSPSIRSCSPENFYDQCSLTSKITQSPLAGRHLPESIYGQRSPTPNVTPPPLTRNNSFENTDNQWSQASTKSNTINVSSSSLIGPFKSDLEVCLYLVQHPALINLALSIINADGQESIITQGKVDRFNAVLERDLGTLQMHLKCFFFRTRVINKQIIDVLMRSLFPDVQHAGASERAALQKWVFGSAFLKRHMDVTDVQRTFRDRHDNIEKFTNFIRSAFNLFVQEILLNKNVINAVKNLNYITVDMEIFTADGKDSLRQLDLSFETIQREECSQNTVSQASLVSINGDDSSESLQENFSDNESLQENFFDSESLQENFSDNESLQGSFFERSQHNDFECNSSVVSDTSSGSDQLSIIEDIGLQTEENFNEIIVDSRIDFQPLPEDEVTYLINPPTVIGPVIVWLQDTPEPPDYQFCVKEILYSYE